MIVIDAIMRNVNRDRRLGIQWVLVNRLEDLDFADDLCLLPEAHGDMRRKVEDLTNEAEKEGLVINVKQKEVLRINTKQKRFVYSYGYRKEDLDWNPQEERRRWRPRHTWRSAVHSVALENGKSWSEVKRMAGNRIIRRYFVDALCLLRDNGKLMTTTMMTVLYNKASIKRNILTIK